jgi:HSP20 family protein
MLMRFDPFRELDRLNQELWRDDTSGRRMTAMPMDAYRKGDHFVVHFDLPGVDPASIDLTVEKNVLTVRAERRWQLDDATELVVAERPQGSYSRQLFLGEMLDSDNIQATYDQGVLTVTIPVAEAAKPRRVQVNGGGSRAQAISADSTANA